jgi:hypothetical protein
LQGLIAKLMADEVDKRRTSAQHILDTESGVLTADDATSAQRDLGGLSALVNSSARNQTR